MEEHALYNTGQLTEHIDEYNIRRLGPDRFEVYRILGAEPGGAEVHYCEGKMIDTALIIARALNFTTAADGRIVQTFPFNDGHIFLVIKGDEAEQAYLKALPILQRGQ